MSPAGVQADGGPVRIVRVIARLNIGGPAIQAITLTKHLEEHGYATTLVRGREDSDEGSMDYVADELGVRPALVPWLRRNPGWHDLLALVALVRIIRRERPEIVHTHAAKAGTLGRLASLIVGCSRLRGQQRPILIHTFHGHSLTGYFSPRVTAIYRRIEQLLGSFTDCLIAVSEEVRVELVEMGVASASKFEVVPLGFDLSPFMVSGQVRAQARGAVRADLGIPPDARVVTLIARLVPIKRVDRFLRVANAVGDLDDVRFVIVGDGELRGELQRSDEARALGDRLIWAGFRRDVAAVCFASDLVMLTSDNEGTPVTLIEAQAAGIPVASTRVGGTASVVAEGESGFVTPPEDEAALIAATRALLTDPDRAALMGQAGRARTVSAFDLGRLVSDLDGIYRALLAARRRGTSRIGPANPTGPDHPPGQSAIHKPNHQQGDDHRANDVRGGEGEGRPRAHDGGCGN